MSAIDPALGLSGALTTLQQQPPLTAAANLNPMADSGQGTSDLASAARSLESVQGNISGQTQAIQQMAMGSQQQSINLQQLMGQLGSQVSGLMQAVSQLTNGVGMGAATGNVGGFSSAPQMQPAGVNALSSGGGLALRGGMMAAGGMAAFGGAFGSLGATMASPFFGGPVSGAGPGQMAPNLSPDIGLMRGMGLATGFGLDPRLMRQAGSSQISEMGRERMQNSFGDTAVGVAGGLGRFGSAIGGEMIGAGILGGMGIGGVAGAIGGAALGIPIAAVGGMAIDRVAGQTSNIRGAGQQFANNAFRFMPGGSMGMSATRRPGTSQRQQFGRSVNKMGIEDLTFDSGDMTEMFAGMSQQDLMRGVGSVDEVVDRFRQTKETFKTIGRRMSQGLQEAAGTMGALQGLGLDPIGKQGRGAIFGASSVVGLTPTEAMNRGIASARGSEREGIGAEVLNLSLSSQAGAQTAIAGGALDNRDIAALGGREGAGQSMKEFTTAFMRSQLGKATLLTGAGGEGMSATEVLTAAGSRASDTNRLVRLQMGGSKMKQEFLSNNIRARSSMLNKIKGIADTYSNVDKKTAMILAMQQVAKNGGLELTDVEAEANLKIFENMPQEVRDRQREMAARLSEETRDTAVEETSMFAIGKRKLDRMATPFSEALDSFTTSAGRSIGRASERMGDAITGRDVISMGEKLTIEGMESLRGRDGVAVEQKTSSGLTFEQNRSIASGVSARREQKLISGQTPSKRTKAMAAKKAGNMFIKHGVKLNKLKEIINEPGTSSDKRRTAMQEVLQIISGETYDKIGANTSHGAAYKRAFQEEVTRLLGVSPTSALTGTELDRASFTFGDKANLNNLRDEIGDMIDSDNRTETAGFISTEMRDLAKALETGSGISDALNTAKDKGFEAQAKKLIGLDLSDDDLSSLGNKLGKAIPLQGRQSAAARIQKIGRNASGIITDLTQKNLGKGLFGLNFGSQNADMTTESLGRLIKGSTEDDIAAMGASDAPGAKRMSDIIRQLKNIDHADGIQPDEAKKIAELTGLDRDSSFIKNLDSDKKMGEVLAMAFDTATPGSMTTTVAGNVGVTQQMANNMTKMQDNIERTRVLLEKLFVKIEG